MRWERSGAGKSDPASGPADYENNHEGAKTGEQEKLDGEMLTRRKIGRRMSILAVVAMGLFSFTFFFYAILFAHSFIDAYRHHVKTWVENGNTPELSTVVPFMVPMVPAFFFSVLGVITMITCMRFITAYVNPQDDDQNGELLQRLIREVASAIKTVKGGGSGDPSQG
ncbi:hypothetical protein NPJ88_013825 [Halomonas elongata]|uniref:hypothetical protein n=1 Tax=Halomonas elongata TaxID=2746 RepID=UPI00255AFB5B|nr:hypothetical protein [Halomonas elongata]MDL4863416.1 hypothetical protein [Halomonas elongata]